DNREIRVGEEYKYPEISEDPRKKEKSFYKILEDGELVRRIASDLNLGGTYAEEICSRLEIDKTRKTESLEEEEKEKVNETIKNFFDESKTPEPILYLRDDGYPERAAPFTLNNYSDFESEKFDTFSEALDEYFYRRKSREKEQKKKEALQEKKDGLKRQLNQQKQKKEGLKKSSEQNREKAELIYKKYNELEAIKKQLEESINKNGWKKTREKIKNSEKELSNKINSINEQEEFFSVEVDGKNIKLRPDKNLEATASRYYDKAKESEEKLESVEKALKDTKEKLENLEEEEIDYEEAMEDKTKKRNKKWFEKYRWFFSSENYLIIVGRDAQT
ncbi:MAG: NFACT family protein, partial [Candidatus Nanohaloarchaea archaeon]